MSTSITLPTTPITSMTSKEIAELTGKRHADVMRDVRNMVERLEKFNQNNPDADLRSAPQVSWHCDTEHYVDANGQAREMYRLDRDTTHCLIAGYDPVPRMRIIKRLAELEAQQTALPMEVIQAAMLDVIQPMQAQIEHLAWMVENNPRKRPGRVYRSVDIAFHLAMDARQLHKEAMAIGLLQPVRVRELLMWKITEEGERYAKYSSGGTRRTVDGETLSNSLWWSFDVVQYIKNYSGARYDLTIPKIAPKDKSLKLSKSAKLMLTASGMTH